MVSISKNDSISANFLSLISESLTMQYSIVKCILCTAAIAAAALLVLLQYEPSSLLLGHQPESDHKHIISNSAQNNVPSVTSNNNNEEKNKNGLSSTSIKQHEHDRSLSWVTNYFGTNTYPSLSNELSVEELSEQSERDIEYKRLRTHATDDTARMKWEKSSKSNHTIDKSTKSGKSTSTATGKSRKAKRFSPPKDKEVRGTKNRLLSWVSIFFDAYFSQSTPEVRNAQSFILLNILCESL